MYLRAEQYQQIVAQLRSGPARGHGSERRASPRAGLRAQVRVVPCLANLPSAFLTGWIRDISTDGVGLLLPEAIERGGYLVLTLPADPKSTLDVLYQCVRCEPLSQNQFSVGARFDRFIAPEEIGTSS